MAESALFRYIVQKYWLITRNSCEKNNETNSNDSFPKGLVLEDVVRLYCKIKIAQYSGTHRIMRSVYIHRLHNYPNTLCSRNIKLMSILIVQKAMRCHQKIICPQEELKEFSNWLIKNFNLNPSERPKKNLNAFNHWIRD